MAVVRRKYTVEQTERMLARALAVHLNNHSKRMTMGAAYTLLKEIKHMYDSPDRHYHGWDHVLDLSDHIIHTHGQELRMRVHRGVITPDTRALDSSIGWSLVAVLFHDCVYVPGGSDNELRSIDVYKGVLSRCKQDSGTSSEYVISAIMSTAGLEPPQQDDLLWRADNRVTFSDDWSDISEWERLVWLEHQHFGRYAYLNGRIDFLRKIESRNHNIARLINELQLELASQYGFPF